MRTPGVWIVLTRMKRDYFRELRDAKGSEDAMEHIMEEAAKARIRCPLLDSNDQCVLYDYRPITTCRLTASLRR